jgi:hypothetical protein
MTTEEAKSKLCPLMSSSEQETLCVGSKCMLWQRFLKDKSRPFIHEELMAISYLDKETQKIEFEGYCGLLGHKTI